MPFRENEPTPGLKIFCHNSDIYLSINKNPFINLLLENRKRHEITDFLNNFYPEEEVTFSYHLFSAENLLIELCEMEHFPTIHSTGEGIYLALPGHLSGVKRLKTVQVNTHHTGVFNNLTHIAYFLLSPFFFHRLFWKFSFVSRCRIKCQILPQTLTTRRSVVYIIHEVHIYILCLGINLYFSILEKRIWFSAWKS